MRHNQQIRDVDPLLGHCWNTVDDAGPTLGQRLMFVGNICEGCGHCLIVLHSSGSATALT